jgi:hypothetical protein
LLLAWQQEFKQRLEAAMEGSLSAHENEMLGLKTGWSKPVMRQPVMLLPERLVVAEAEVGHDFD